MQIITHSIILRRERVNILRKVLRGNDDNFIAHYGFGDAIGAHPSAPFRVDPSEDGLRISWRMNESAQSFIEAAKKNAKNRNYFDGVDWGSLTSRETDIAACFRFTVDVAAIRRENASRKEVAMPPEMFPEWFIARMDGVKLSDCSCDISGRKTQRRINGRTRDIVFPVATVTGVAEVVDCSKARTILMCGIGRHKSFGMGMIHIESF